MSKAPPSPLTKRSPANSQTATHPPHAVRGPAPGESRLEIPPILLEGDDPWPTPACEREPSHSIASEPTTEQGAGSRAPKAPVEGHGTSRLLLIARDPQWLYAGWDLTREQLRDYNRQSADGHLILRVHRDSLAGERVAEAHVHPESRHWFVHVGHGATRFAAELGYRREKDGWVRVCASGTMRTPPERVSADTSVQYATLPPGVPILGLAPAAGSLPAKEPSDLPAPINTPATEAIPSGESVPPVHGNDQPESAKAPGVFGPELTAEQEPSEWVPAGTLQEIASLAAAHLTAPVEESDHVSSPEGRLPAPKSFGLSLNADLVLHGATTPDAMVSIGGRRITLRPDGTFSLRFTLPDGQFPLGVVAMSADATQARWANLQFARSTQSGGGEIGAPPESPSLTPPGPEGV